MHGVGSIRKIDFEGKSSRKVPTLLIADYVNVKTEWIISFYRVEIYCNEMAYIEALLLYYFVKNCAKR